MGFSSEVLIYIQSVKNYFKVNVEAREYFLKDVDEDLFFKHLGEISQKNFDKDGEVMLTQIQFELLRKTMLALNIVNKKEFEKPTEELTHTVYEDSRVFIDYPNFGKICLN